MRLMITGKNGLVGKSLIRYLGDFPDIEIIAPTKTELDCLDYQKVTTFMKDVNPDCVVHLAAKVGGIEANNNFPAQFIHENLLMNVNVIHSAHANDINKLLFLGSACIYPKNISGALKESMLLSGVLEATNEPYAISKIAGIKMCESYFREYGRDFRCIVPTNIYGPNDHFQTMNSHVVPALIRKFHYAVQNSENNIEIWGSGAPIRDFLYVDDLSRAIRAVLQTDESNFRSLGEDQCSHVNVGSGVGCSIKSLVAELVEQFKFRGNITYNTSRPDGMAVKVLDNGLINRLGWQPSTSLSEGLKETISWYITRYFE